MAREWRRLKIYVAGPYSAPTEGERLDHVRAALDAGVKLIQSGYIPYIPHLTHYLEEWARIQYGVGIPYEEWLRQDFAWLDQCDALLYLGPSPGADRELLRAIGRGMKIYRKVEEIDEEAEGWGANEGVGGGRGVSAAHAGPGERGEADRGTAGAGGGR